MYKRKTHDEWVIESWNDDLREWNLESAYDNRADCKRDFKIYKEECPSLKLRFRKVRVRNERTL